MIQNESWQQECPYSMNGSYQMIMLIIQSELNEIKLKLKSGSADSKASAAFFDAIFEDPEAKVNSNTQMQIKSIVLGIIWCSEK